MKKTGKIKSDPFADREASRYQHPIPSREYILSKFKLFHVPQSRKQLENLLGIQSEFEREAFRRRLRAMVRDGQLDKTRRGTYAVVKPQDLIRGYVIGHKDGFGFLSPDDGTADVFLSAREMRTVFHGDVVEVRITNADRKNKREGSIVKIIERKSPKLAGRFFIESGVGFVVPDNTRIAQDIVIPIKEQAKAKPGQLVEVEIVKYPTLHSQAIGKIIEVLGDYMAPGLEIEVAIRANEIPYQWPDSVLKAVEKIPETVSEKEKECRVDLRALPLVTIDGEDAKDFDDAVYCERQANDKGWRLIVAIADVSHYVKPNTALDKEALERGNSVYFPGRVVPMLPTQLSNDLCSLNPHVDRLCLVCDMVLDGQGNIKRSRFDAAVMHSHARLTYTNVAKILENNHQVLKKQYQNVLPNLMHLHALYKVLEKNREKRGALDFDTQEIKVEFGAGRKIKRLYPAERNVAHKIIEECMLCANISAAKFLLKHKAPGLFRVHDAPNIDKFTELKTFLGELGLSIRGGDLPLPKDYATLIEQIKNRPDSHMIQMVLLRSLAQAIYSPINDGHFGLAFDEYTHFTSPIRRYPDLIVHRAIKSVIEKKRKKCLTLNEEVLQKMGEHCSMTERRADEATRDALNWLKCEYMLDKVGAEFEGVISGVTGFGFFVELKDVYIEGLVSVTSLKNDFFHFDPVRHRLMGERTRKVYHMGDVVRIKVINVSLENKQINLEIL